MFYSLVYFSRPQRRKCLLGPPSVHRWKMGDSNLHHFCVLKFLNSFLLSHCPKEFVTSQLLVQTTMSPLSKQPTRQTFRITLNSSKPLQLTTECSFLNSEPLLIYLYQQNQLDLKLLFLPWLTHSESITILISYIFVYVNDQSLIILMVFL